MTRVYIHPKPGGDVGGIARVIDAQRAHLSAFDIEVVDDPRDAEVIAAHAMMPRQWSQLYPRTPVVAHNHGIYWTPEYEWPKWALTANDEVMQLIRAADFITGPSEWVSQAIRRMSSRRVLTVYHGIDGDEWPLQEAHRGYVLWNKSRPDPVCDPGMILPLASLMPDVEFVTTFSERTSRTEIEYHQGAPNVNVTGAVPYAEAKAWVQGAGVYLCTTRETFGIGTLEAMASGVPVVGWKWGGQAEFIEHGVDGWLVEPNDIAGLAEGIRWALANREALAPVVRAKALEFSWRAAARTYAEIYHMLASRERMRETETPRTSIIVTAHNLERYLPATLDSVLAQTDPNVECIVVDDASPDRCGEIADEYAARSSGKIRVIHNERNVYLAEARNIGIDAARGRYILPLDADDQLAPDAVQILADALDADRSLHIAYGGVRFVDEDGATPTNYGPRYVVGHSGWPVPFELRRQLANGSNLLPYASMYRRDVAVLTGGYRRRWRTGEDADFWTRATSYGFTARMVTTADTLIYRNRPESMSRREGGRRDWPAWYPWVRDARMIPGAADVAGETPTLKPSFEFPRVAVVIPVGPGHADLVLDAIDSVAAQTFEGWECIVANDTGEALPWLPTWVKVVEPECDACCGSGDELPGVPCELCGGEGLLRYGGVAAARNAAIAEARAPLFLPLDADDYLQPAALATFLAAYDSADVEGHPGVIVYSDFWEDPDKVGEWRVWEAPDWEPRQVLRGARWAVTCLTPVKAWSDVGGYDAALPAWEDWAFHLATSEAGYCMRRVAAPLFTYRKHTGTRRDDNLARDKRPEHEAAIKARFGKYWEGAEMPCSSCGGGSRRTFSPTSQIPGSRREGPLPDRDGATLVEYTGDKSGFTLRARPSGTAYRFAAGAGPVYVLDQDVPFLTKFGDYQVVAGEGVGTEAITETPTLIAEGAPAS